MGEHKPYTFNPDGNDLKRVFYYYGLEMEEQIICPFHDDHNPSAHVNFDEGIFHCFACGASGDAYQFVKMANPKLGDLECLRLYHAILKSKKVSKLKLSKSRTAKSRKRKEKERQLDYEIAYDYYHGLKTIDWSKEDSTYKDYLLNRGFTSSTLTEYKAKLTYTNENYPIIFPIMDNGRFRGYVCRTLNKRIQDKRGKYLYNKGFSRRDTLAGDYKGPIVVLCEGYLDQLKLKQFGLKNVAAILGWKITTTQVEKLKAMGVKTVISALDTDKPGIKGTDYLHNFFDVIRFQFPKGAKDPGDLNKKQFDIAYRKTKRLYRRRKNEHS